MPETPSSDLYAKGFRVPAPENNRHWDARGMGRRERLRTYKRAVKAGHMDRETYLWLVRLHSTPETP